MSKAIREAEKRARAREEEKRKTMLRPWRAKGLVNRESAKREIEYFVISIAAKYKLAQLPYIPEILREIADEMEGLR